MNTWDKIHRDIKNKYPPLHWYERLALIFSRELLMTRTDDVSHYFSPPSIQAYQTYQTVYFGGQDRLVRFGIK